MCKRSRVEILLTAGCIVAGLILLARMWSAGVIGPAERTLLRDVQPDSLPVASHLARALAGDAPVNYLSIARRSGSSTIMISGKSDRLHIDHFAEHWKLQANDPPGDPTQRLTESAEGAAGIATDFHKECILMTGSNTVLGTVELAYRPSDEMFTLYIYKHR